jgi:transposase
MQAIARLILMQPGRRAQSGYEPYKRGLNAKIHLAVDGNAMPVGILITEGIRADCKEAVPLIQGLAADALLADRGYDTQDVDYALASDMTVVIPPKRNRKEQRKYDRHLYKLRHLVENAFLHLKRWRGLATRYAKNSASFGCRTNLLHRHLGGCLA